MTSCTLKWHADRGFELDVEAEDDEIAIRMVGVPVPVDGTRELSEGAELDRLDILFKAQVDVEDQPGQLQEVHVKVLVAEGASVLALSAKIEDVETGDILPFSIEIPVQVPGEAPEAGGPRPVPQDEDELDWEDETTLEQMVVNAPETTGSHPPPPKEGAGLQALLKALAEIPEDEEAWAKGEGEAEGEGEAPADGPGTVDDLPPDLAPVALEPEPEPSVEDQIMSPVDEARGLLELLIRGEHLELEEEYTVDDLAPGLSDFVSLPISAPNKAARISEWLLEQDAVADLFIADDDLATILEQW